MEDCVRVGVAIHVIKEVIENGDTVQKYLLTKRIGSLGNNKWCSPGGKIDMGETPFECALRELKEEVGEDLVVNILYCHGVTNDIFQEEQKHYITIHIISEYISGEPKNNEPNKCSEIKWDDIYKMDKNDLFLPMINYVNYDFVENEL